MCIPTTASSLTGTALASDSIPDCVPSDDLSQAAYKYASQLLHPAILNHSIRVFLYAKEVAVREASEWSKIDRLPLLFTASIMHDVGTTDAHNGAQRFEVEGADAAVAVMRDSGTNASEQDMHDVWVAIAIHTSPGIAERISPLARLVRIGVSVDFKRSPHLEGLSSVVQETEGTFPRAEIEKVLGDAVVEQAMRQPAKAPAASWPGIMLRSAKENPGWTGVNQAF
ncbi:hypothetical protein BDY17DRAFT_319596 [Neohortaea acidophila]|uniref:HD domain-containing protein n=1 Tax=Neohortaea acidophila TaxID=245834 RepID=A0A6A6Q6K3_9PEZI|nr:uncharacterized protein BDY17DRAFT_319596 [Neohortaea acidophila]KAF2487027.1 hypothetical protein BDY17DRAFT_319596 [Neohortaea acidophila]